MTPADRLAALVEKWRKEAAVWQHGIGENQNTRMYQKCADELATVLASMQAEPVAWRPISEAPKDGIDQVVYDAGALLIANWIEDEQGWWEATGNGGILNPPPTHYLAHIPPVPGTET